MPSTNEPSPPTAPRALSREALFARVGKLFPEGTRGRDLLRFARLSKRDGVVFADKVRQHWAAWGVDGPVLSYTWWLHSHGITSRVRTNQETLARQAIDPISIHVVILANSESDSRPLAATLRSLGSQTWTRWRATVFGATATADTTDDRVVVASREAGLPSKSLPGQLDGLAERDFILFLEAGDRLAPDCLFLVAEMAWRNPAVDVVYWDDDLVNSLGVSHEPRFRPEWSPEILLGANYLGRSFAMRARRFEAAGGLRDDLGDARWWDLVMRADLAADNVRRVPRVLAHLGSRPSPSADASLRVVREHLERHHERASLAIRDGVVSVAWDVDDWPRVSVIIPTCHNRPLIERCLRSLARTAYDGFDILVMDNGARTPENESWYRDEFSDLDLTVEWWELPFNYSAVNNYAASMTHGEILVFLNDDTEISDPSWLSELVRWARRPELGVVGLQLVDGGGHIQHGGVILGLNGFADHLFEGMDPSSETMFGPTTWYRNVLAVTAACLAVRRQLYEELGGFDERFVLCGSDVVLGIDAVIAGKRNVCLPSNGVRHLEASTRGTNVPAGDFFASYWRYQRWIFGGDPYFSPNLSLLSRRPELRALHETTPHALVAGPLGRRINVFRQQNEPDEATRLAHLFRATDQDVDQVRQSHDRTRGPKPPNSVTWFLPDIDSPFYGGVNTALRIADYLARTHGVDNRFAFWADENDLFFRSALSAAFPALGDAPIYFFENLDPEGLARIPDSDAAVATLWATAYAVAKFRGVSRRFYLVQDFEPCFYPAGTLYALAEESYRLGLYGLCNTEHMLDLYRMGYGGAGDAFTPAVDQSVFHAEGRSERRPGDPVTVFVYARPGHFRNCWEMARIALEEAKQRLGDRVRIVTAGSWAYDRERELGSGIEHLGLLDYRETGALYRRCDVGVALTVSQHPSYLPLELMACGVPVVAYDNPAGYWLLEHEENSLLVRRTVDGLSDGIERLVLDAELRTRLQHGGLRTIAQHHSSWDKALSDLYAFFTDPAGVDRHAGEPGVASRR